MEPNHCIHLHTHMTPTKSAQYSDAMNVNGYCCATSDIMALIIPIVCSTLLASGCLDVTKLVSSPLFSEIRELPVTLP